MRMPVYQLGIDPVDHFLHGKSLFFLAYLSIKNNVKEQIAQFLTDARKVFVQYRVG